MDSVSWSLYDCLSFCLIVTSCDLNSDMYPASHSLTIETSDISVRMGMMWPSRASSGKAGKSSRHGFLDCLVLTFMHPTLMGGPIFIDGKCGASTCK